MGSLRDPEQMPLAEVPSVLLALDLRVASDPASSGFIGHLVIAVRDQIATFWSADFTRSRFGFFRREPAFCDAILSLTPKGAAALLRGTAPHPSDTITAVGDARLVERFVRRYSHPQKALALRAGDCA